MTKTSAREELRQKSEAFRASEERVRKAYSCFNQYKGYLGSFYGEKWQLSDLTGGDFECFKSFNQKLSLALVERDRNEKEYYLFVAELLS